MGFLAPWFLASAAAVSARNSRLGPNDSAEVNPWVGWVRMAVKADSAPAKADSAGTVLAARVPIILTSRADSVRSRLASCPAAVLYAEARRKGAALPAA